MFQFYGLSEPRPILRSCANPADGGTDETAARAAGIVALRGLIRVRFSQADAHPALTFGIAGIDARLPCGRLGLDALHEIAPDSVRTARRPWASPSRRQSRRLQLAAGRMDKLLLVLRTAGGGNRVRRPQVSPAVRRAARERGPALASRLPNDGARRRWTTATPPPVENPPKQCNA